MMPIVRADEPPRATDVDMGGRVDAERLLAVTAYFGCARAERRP